MGPSSRARLWCGENDSNIRKREQNGELLLSSHMVQEGCSRLTSKGYKSSAKRIVDWGYCHVWCVGWEGIPPWPEKLVLRSAVAQAVPCRPWCVFLRLSALVTKWWCCKTRNTWGRSQSCFLREWSWCWEKQRVERVLGVSEVLLVTFILRPPFPETSKFSSYRFLSLIIERAQFDASIIKWNLWKNCLIS